ncbi:MAG: acyl-CoA reductase [Planctomycetaceae bacterium]|jgi:hypothetical protein
MSPGTDVGIDYGRSAHAADLPLTERLAWLRKQRSEGHYLPYLDRLAALETLGQALVERRATLPPVLAGTGVAFLAAFLQRCSLEGYVQREIPRPESLQQFVECGDRKSLRILPRGLVCHWIAGNVPLLGMFSWALSALLGNVNAIRLSSRQADTMSPLLELLAETSPAGRQMADETLVCSFPRELEAAHQALSDAADVRIAWGGQESIEAVRRLPCRWDCDDIVMGPRISVAVVDPALAAPATVSRLATDVVFFDQAACSSPQVIFVRGAPGEAGFEHFLTELARAMGEQTARFPRHPLDFGETYRIELDRARALMAGGTIRRDESTRWTIAILDRVNPRLACTNCFVQVVPCADWQPVWDFLPENIQTIVTLLPADEFGTFTEQAARRGACRFPVPGTGNHFDVPWDGIPLVSRLTRWVLRTDPSPV